MISCSQKSVSFRRTERGYILLTLILFVALITIAAVVTAPIIAHQMKRDREEELIHRGVQYSRAMKHFYKKLGHYPTRIEELENTNNVRFLRRRYKDPITGKDFKILHLGDVQMGLGGAAIAGATPVNGLNPGAAAAAGLAGSSPFGQRGGLGGLAGGVASAMNPVSQAPGANTTAAPSSGVPAPNSDDSEDNPTAGATPNPGTPGQGTGLTAATPVAPGTPGAPGTAGAAGTGTSANGAQTFGGGPMVGVASTSKEKSIRIFNKKDHYNQWQFIYDPSSDRGGLLTTPNQPALQGNEDRSTGTPGTPGTPGTQGTTGGATGLPGSAVPPGQPTPPGSQLPQMPPEQEP